MTAIGVRSGWVRGGPRLDVKALVVFFFLAYSLSWSWAIPLTAAHLVVRRGEGWPTHYPLLLAPAIAAVVVTAWTMGRPGVRDLLARMARWRVPVCRLIERARTAIITNNDTLTGKLISTPPGAAALSLGDFVMAHRHMQGIRRRAEAQWRAIAWPGAGPSPL